MSQAHIPYHIQYVTDPSVDPEGIGAFVSKFISVKPKIVTSRAMIEALYIVNDLDPNMGVAGHRDATGLTVGLAIQHKLTLSALIRAELDLQEYRKHNLGLPFMQDSWEEYGIHPVILIEAEEDSGLTWNDYIKFLNFIQKSIKMCFLSVPHKPHEIEIYKSRLRYRLAVALRITCLLTDYDSSKQWTASVAAQVRILRSLNTALAYSDFEHKVHVEPLDPDSSTPGPDTEQKT